MRLLALFGLFALLSFGYLTWELATGAKTAHFTSSPHQDAP